MNLHGLDDYIKDNASKICIGTFDGFHKGHQELAKNSDYLVTFFPHPKSIISNIENFEVLTFPEELNFLFRNKITIPFEDSIQKMTATRFLDEIIGKLLKPTQITIGYDFKFGVNQTGDINLLHKWGRKNNCKIIEIPKKIHPNGIPYKSSIIRKELKNDVNLAFELLGHEYPIFGTVIEGKKRGKKIGIPTANLKPTPGKCIPKNGVYSSSIIINEKKYPSITNIGTNPTYNNKETSIETHILNDFNTTIYNKNVLVLLKHFIREEIKFESNEALIEQIKKDINHPLIEKISESIN